MTQNKKCKALVTLLGAAKVIFPGQAGYNETLVSYHSPQAASVHPACFVTPETVTEVSDVIRTLSSSPRDSDLALRGGGHMWIAGSNSAPNGVSIDLRGLNEITLDSNQSTVDVGAGATWDQVYVFLDQVGLSVSGGRVAGVGVGGVTLGGGISYFGPREGWTCDTVTSFQVVLADGSVVEASEHENADLWKGLRGGMNNFGVVTRMTFKTFTQTDLLWYSLRLSPPTEIDAQVSIYGELMAAENYDDYSSYLTGWVYLAEQGVTLVQNELVYTKEFDGESPSYYDDIVALPTVEGGFTVSANASTLARNSMQFRPAQAFRYMTATTTFIASEEMIRASYDAFNVTLPLVEDVTGITWTVVLEPLPPSLYKRYGADQNSLGLNEATETLVVFLASASWSSAEHDEQVYSAARLIIENIETKAKLLARYNPFIYVNYAAPWQEVIRSYGFENLWDLQRLRDRVDPTYFFTKKLKGGFKIPFL